MAAPLSPAQLAAKDRLAALWKGASHGGNDLDEPATPSAHPCRPRQTIPAAYPVTFSTSSHTTIDLILPPSSPRLRASAVPTP